jgi:hypothetical protein
MRVALMRRYVAGLQQDAPHDAQPFEYSIAAVAEKSSLADVSGKCTGQTRQR